MFAAIKALLAGISLVVTAVVTPTGALVDGISATSTMCVESHTSEEVASSAGAGSASDAPTRLDDSADSAESCASQGVVATCAYGEGETTYLAHFYATDGGTCASAAATCDALGGVIHCL